MSTLRILVATTLSVGTAACASAVGTPGSPPPPAAVGGFRIVSPDEEAELAFPEMIDQLARADVVFFGEQHDDPEAHRAELAVLDAIGRTGRPVVLSLEMFERDVQPLLDDYLAGGKSEADFIARSRPWPRYATDYRALVELARAQRWPVVASNVPRPLASAIGRRGLAALDTLAPAERRNAATGISCPRDDYRARFLETMRTHSPGTGSAPQPGDTLPTATAERFYLSQCVKDETMAESIVEARRRASPRAIVLHVTGAFHSDYAQGVVARVRRREPAWRLAVITAIPVRDVALAPVAPQRGRGDFVIFTRR
jgi:uncharacterized iron-regulated protein